jgi:hypothetical protein
VVWERGLATIADLWSFPFRRLQQERPTWVSLAWSRKIGADTVQDEVLLPARATSGLDLVTTNMERLGPDANAQSQILAKHLKAEYNAARDGLLVVISGLSKLEPQVGHYVGFVTHPQAPRPVAIVFLTITE